MLETRGAKITEKLSHVLVGECANGLQLDDQLLINEKVGEELAEGRAIFIENVQRVLLCGGEPLLAQAMGETVFINFLHMAVAKVAMQREAGFTD